MDYSKINEQELAAELCCQFEDFKKTLNLTKAKIDPWVVCVAVTSWKKDLERYDAFHKSNKPDLCKQAAFMVYWLVKTKPIFAETPGANSKYIAINEIFAFAYVLNELKIEAGRISDDFFDRFVYSLYFRDTTAKQMFFQFELLDKLNKIAPAPAVII